MVERRAPGTVRDAIFRVFHNKQRELTLVEICELVSKDLGQEIPPSSVRSYLNINTPGRFERTARGTYRFTGR